MNIEEFVDRCEEHYRSTGHSPRSFTMSYDDRCELLHSVHKDLIHHVEIKCEDGQVVTQFMGVRLLVK